MGIGRRGRGKGYRTKRKESRVRSIRGNFNRKGHEEWFEVRKENEGVFGANLYLQWQKNVVSGRNT